MTFNSLGDMAQAFSLRHRNTVLKLEIQNLNNELATGKASDLADHLGGSYARLTGVERDIRVLKGYEINITEARQFTDVMQARLEQISNISSDFAGGLIVAAASSDRATGQAMANEAKFHFSTIVDTLNSQSAGRSLFAGDATDQAALADPDLILAELDTVLAGAASLSELETRIDFWFNDPAGFDAFAYGGSTNPIAAFKMSDAASVPVDIRANATEIKDILKSLTKALVSNSSDYGLTFEDQNTLRKHAAEEMMTGQEKLIGLQSNLGLAQEQVEQWSVRTQTERIGLDYARGALIAIDPFQAATELEAARFQLESLYTVTARLSQLSLVNFLR